MINNTITSFGYDLLTQCVTTCYLLRIILFFRHCRLLVFVEYKLKYIYMNDTYNVRVHGRAGPPALASECGEKGCT